MAPEKRLHYMKTLKGMKKALRRESFKIELPQSPSNIEYLSFRKDFQVAGPFNDGEKFSSIQGRYF